MSATAVLLIYRRLRIIFLRGKKITILFVIRPEFDGVKYLCYALYLSTGTLGTCHLFLSAYVPSLGRIIYNPLSVRCVVDTFILYFFFLFKYKFRINNLFCNYFYCTPIDCSFKGVFQNRNTLFRRTNRYTPRTLMTENNARTRALSSIDIQPALYIYI